MIGRNKAYSTTANQARKVKRYTIDIYLLLTSLAATLLICLRRNFNSLYPRDGSDRECEGKGVMPTDQPPVIKSHSTR